MKNSIIPDIINSKGIRFFGEDGTEVKICDVSPFRFVNTFTEPFILFDTFAKKTTIISDLVFLKMEDLTKYGLGVFSVKLNRSQTWYPRQKVMHVIADVNRGYPNAARVFNPPKLRLQKDKATNSVRLVGISAGPYHNQQEGGAGPFIKLPEDKI